MGRRSSFMKRDQEIKGKTLKRIPDGVQKLAALISAAGTICALFGGIGQWIVHEVTASTNSRIDTLETKMDDNQKNNELAVTRLELMNLLQTDPDNVIEIEKLGRHYFRDLKGNAYMSGLISRWCTEHSVDCGEIMLK